MKILSLSMNNVFRPRDGTSLTVYNRWRRLGPRHELTMVLANVDQTDPDPWVRHPSEYARKVIVIPSVPTTFTGRLERKLRRMMPWISRETGFWLNREARRAVVEELKKGGYDLVQVEVFPMFWTLPSDLGAPIVYNCSDILSRFVADELDAARSPIKRFWYKRQYEHIRRLELANWARCSAILPLTKLEGDLIRRDVPSANVIVAANGVDLEFLQPPSEPPNPGEIAFVGALDVAQNIDAVTWYAENAFPIVRNEAPNAIFTVVGRNPHPDITALEANPGVQIVGEVPDIRPYLSRASVVVSPVRLGGGMKGKTIEAMAMAKPLVSTTFAAEGVDYTPGENILLADAPEELARATIRVLRDPELANRLGAGGRRLVEAKYSWDAIVELYDEAYRQTVSAK